jgi:DNA modification methylase
MTITIDKSEIKMEKKDCLKELKKLASESVDLVITDPPYGIGFEGKDWDSFSIEEFHDFNIEWMSEVYRVLKPTGTFWCFCGPTKIPEMFKVVEEVGFKNHLENWFIYARPKGRGASKKMKSLREDILHLTKSDTYTWNSVEYLRKVVVPYTGKDGKPRGWALDATTGEPMRFTGLGNVCFFTPPYYLNKFEKQIHSCQKPILLLAMLMMASSKKGDIILDPFFGSGSIIATTILCERNFIGFEQDKEMFDKAHEWITNIDYVEAEKYIHRHASTTEKGFKFGCDLRGILPKATK